MLIPEELRKQLIFYFENNNIGCFRSVDTRHKIEVLVIGVDDGTMTTEQAILIAVHMLISGILNGATSEAVKEKMQNEQSFKFPVN